MGTSDAVSVRPTSAADFAELRALFDDPSFHGWGGPSPLPDAVIRAKYLGARLPEVECFLVLRHGEAVGLAQLHAADDRHSGGMDLILLARVRGAGIGRAVVSILVERARSVHGWSRLTVDPEGPPCLVRLPPGPRTLHWLALLTIVSACDDSSPALR
ncbi:GNAT family N-acetyltransferase [Brachybacterium sp. GCM10030268]|uniref:GNAT family N-acetyltransferase n=1 Tax=Brachybacterium sp. GCM10030268 TaxID=3273382 RepID=UPI0036129AD4